MLPSNNTGDQNNGDNMVLTEVKILRTGTTFGELALISKKPRAATIICKEDCDFGILEKKDFNRILKVNEEKKLIEEMNFFANLSIFHHWNFNLVKQLYLNTHSMHFIKDDYVYKENDESEAVFIIKSGDFMVNSFLKDFFIVDTQVLKQIIIDDTCDEYNADVARYSIDKIRKHFGAHSKKTKLAEVLSAYFLD